MSGSDRKYRTDEQLRSDAAYNRRMMNTFKLRAEASEAELKRREDLPHHGHKDATI